MKSYKVKVVYPLNIIVPVVSYFVFQGMRYMYWKELVLRLALEILIYFALTFVLSKISSFLLAHLICVLLYGQIFVLLRYTPWSNKVDRNYLDELIIWVKSKYGDNCLVYVYGSYVRNEIKSTSDLDLRIKVKNGGWVSWLKAFFVTISIKMLSNIRGYPVDIFLFEKDSFLTKMRDDEKPYIL
jgi:predicted nucleotidyltransferase